MKNTNIKDILIKAKNKEIYDIEERISDLKREIFNNQTEMQDLEDEIHEIKKYIADIENKDENSLGRPSLTLKAGDAGLSAAQAKEANEWIIHHEMKHHTEYFFNLKLPGYQGAIGCAHYEVGWAFTSIGDIADITCTDCKQSYSLGEC